MSENAPRNQGNAGKGRCPICGKETAPEFRPFCSRRCRDVDLNRWLSGLYRVETDEAPEVVEEQPPKDSGD